MKNACGVGKNALTRTMMKNDSAFFMTSASESIKGIFEEITRDFFETQVLILAARVVKKPPLAANEECTCGAS